MIHVQRNIGYEHLSLWPYGTPVIFVWRRGQAEEDHGTELEEEMKHNLDKHLRGQFMDRTPVIFCMERHAPAKFAGFGTGLV